MPRPCTTVALLLALLSGGCSAASGEASGEPRSSSTPGTAGQRSSARSVPRSTAPTPTPSTPARGRPGELTIAFGGDIHFAGQLAARLADPTSALSELRPLLATADMAMVNLETAITDRGAPAPKSFHFRSPPSALEAVAAAGVDVVTMANNHAVDYGEAGLRDTLAARAASPVPVVGIGEDRSDALRPAVLRVAGQRVAVLAAMQVPEWTASAWPAGPRRPGVAVAFDPGPLAEAVRQARRSADVVVVYLHWGTDYTGCPNPLQRSTSRALADAGADVVVGTHAHQVQGAGWMGSTYVAYGLGNFVWWRRNNEVEARSGVLTLTLRGRRVVRERWTPLRVSADGIPRQPEPAESQRLLAAWRASRDCADLASSSP